MQHNHEIGRLLGTLHRNARNYFHREFASFGLVGGVHSFLVVLYHQDGLSQNELSRILNFDKAHTTRAIQKLMDSGFIERKRDDVDHRCYRIYLTEKARAHEGEIKEIIHTWTHAISSGLSDSEIQTLIELLDKMTKNVRDLVK